MGPIRTTNMKIDWVKLRTLTFGYMLDIKNLGILKIINCTMQRRALFEPTLVEDSLNQIQPTPALYNFMYYPFDEIWSSPEMSLSFFFLLLQEVLYAIWTSNVGVYFEMLISTLDSILIIMNFLDSGMVNIVDTNMGESMRLLQIMSI